MLLTSVDPDLRTLQTFGQLPGHFMAFAMVFHDPISALPNSANSDRGICSFNRMEAEENVLQVHSEDLAAVLGIVMAHQAPALKSALVLRLQSALVLPDPEHYRAHLRRLAALEGAPRCILFFASVTCILMSFSGDTPIHNVCLPQLMPCTLSNQVRVHRLQSGAATS